MPDFGSLLGALSTEAGGVASGMQARKDREAAARRQLLADRLAQAQIGNYESEVRHRTAQDQHANDPRYELRQDPVTGEFLYVPKTPTSGQGPIHTNTGMSLKPDVRVVPLQGGGMGTTTVRGKGQYSPTSPPAGSQGTPAGGARPGARGPTPIPGAGRINVQLQETEGAINMADKAVTEMEGLFQRSRSAAQPPNLLQQGAAGLAGKIMGPGMGNAVMQSTLRPEQAQFQGAASAFMHTASSTLPKGGRSMGLLQSMMSAYQAASGQSDPALWGTFLQRAREYVNTLHQEFPSTNQATPRPSPAGRAPAPAPQSGRYVPRFWHPHG